MIEIEPRHSPRISCGQITSAGWQWTAVHGWNGALGGSSQSLLWRHDRSPMWGDRKRGANIAVRLDRLGVSPREETTEFDSVNHPVFTGLRDQRSRSSPRGVACSLCPPGSVLRYPSDHALQARRCSCEGVPVPPDRRPQRGYRTGVATPLSATTSLCILFSRLET
jgi:hypothetical protein